MALAAIKGDKTLAELAEQFDVHPNQISEWKHQLQESAADLFGNGPKTKTAEPDIKALHAKIGQLTLVRQCQILELARSTAYYQPTGIARGAGTDAPNRRTAPELPLRRGEDARQDA